VPAVILAPAADAQIVDVLARTFDRFGEHKYLQYRELIRRAFVELEADPRSGTPRPDIHPNAWILHIARRGLKARHLFIYRIRKDVEVARFLYDAMDLPRHRPEEWDEEP
jgi:plasmid stabilization system protein ParE